jgi:flagellar motor switch protein FliG
VTLTGKQKAAMLLMSLDASTAAYLDAAGYPSSEQSMELTRQFYNSLQSGQRFHLKSFLKEMLKNTVGNEKSRQIQAQIQDLLQKRDPFILIRASDSQRIASILADEHPQVIAVVLSELSVKKSSEVLGLLREDVRLSAIHRMTGSETVTAKTKIRIAKMVCKRLEAGTTARKSGALQTRPEQSLRKVAVILRNLSKDLRGGLLSAIQEKDGEAGKMVANLMMVWNDIPRIADKSLQEALRGIDAKNLALALVKADDAIDEKIKSNISERTATMVDEETLFMLAPTREDIKKAREEIVRVLREMNEEGELAFTEEQYDV